MRRIAAVEDLLLLALPPQNLRLTNEVFRVRHVNDFFELESLLE